jgi:hypothetical protein
LTDIPLVRGTKSKLHDDGSVDAALGDAPHIWSLSHPDDGLVDLSLASTHPKKESSTSNLLTDIPTEDVIDSNSHETQSVGAVLEVTARQPSVLHLDKTSVVQPPSPSLIDNQLTDITTGDTIYFSSHHKE